MTPVDDEVMAFWLAANGLGNRGVQRRFAAIAKGAAQIRIVILTKAHIELAGTGHTHPVAAFAEIMGQRGDEAKLAPGFLDLDITGGAAGAERNVGQGKALCQVGANA